MVVSWKGEEANTPTVAAQPVSQQSLALDRPYIRIATLNLAPPSGQSPRTECPTETLAKAFGEYDLIAIQGIESETRRLLLDLVEQMNAANGSFDFAVDSDVGQGVVQRYNAFVYQTKTIETDLRNLFTVDTARQGFRYRPLVGHFRVRGPNPEDAFTFCLINMTIPLGHMEGGRFPIRDAREGLREMDMMAEVFERVEKLIPKEDDIIIVGGLNIHPWYGMQASGFDKWDKAAVDAAIKKGLVVPGLDRLMPYSTAKSIAVGNFFLRRKATVEFTGRADAKDLVPTEDGTYTVKKLAWAEFYSREGAPRVASGETHSW